MNSLSWAVFWWRKCFNFHHINVVKYVTFLWSSYANTQCNAQNKTHSNSSFYHSSGPDPDFSEPMRPALFFPYKVTWPKNTTTVMLWQQLTESWPWLDGPSTQLEFSLVIYCHSYHDDYLLSRSHVSFRETLSGDRLVIFIKKKHIWTKSADTR